MSKADQIVRDKTEGNSPMSNAVVSGEPSSLRVTEGGLRIRRTPKDVLERRGKI